MKETAEGCEAFSLEKIIKLNKEKRFQNTSSWFAKTRTVISKCQYISIRQKKYREIY